MSFWSRPSTTSGLLAINALLLLVLVVQNTRPSAKNQNLIQPVPMAGMPMGHPPMGDRSMEGAVHGTGDQAPMGADGNFDPTLMIFAALNCPSDATITLDAPGCSGKDADDRRTFVAKAYEKDPSIRGVFDSIVKKYGDGALTQQAQAIRKARRGG